MSFSRVLKSIMTLFSANSIGRVLSAIAVLLVARILGPDLFGVYSGSLAVAQLFSALFMLGLESWLLRYGGQDDHKQNELTGSALSITGGLGLFWVLLFVPIVSVVERDHLPVMVNLLAALCIWFDGLNLVIRAAFKARLRNTINVWLILIDGGVFLICVLVALLLPVASPYLFLGGRLAAAVLSFTVGFVVILKAHALRVNWAVIRMTLVQTVPFALSLGLSAIYDRVDVAIVTHALGTKATGIYSSAMSILKTMFLVPASVYGVLLPVLSRVYTQEPEDMLPWVRNALLISSALGVTLGIFSFVISRPLSVGLLGEAYCDVGPVLSVLSWTLAFKSVSFGLGAVITAVGRQSERVVAQLFSAILSVVINLAVVQRADLYLIAVIHVIIELILLIGYGVVVMRWRRDYQQYPSQA